MFCRKIPLAFLLWIDWKCLFPPYKRNIFLQNFKVFEKSSILRFLEEMFPWTQSKRLQCFKPQISLLYLVGFFVSLFVFEYPVDFYSPFFPMSRSSFLSCVHLSVITDVHQHFLAFILA